MKFQGRVMVPEVSQSQFAGNYLASNVMWYMAPTVACNLFFFLRDVSNGSRLDR